MQIKTKLAKLAPFFQSAVVIAISALFVSSIVYAATTIGSSITTGGNLTVTGWASSTSATTTSYLYIGVDGTEPNPWDFKNGDLYVQDDVYLGSQATSVASLWVGSAGTANNLDLAGGDLYVQDDAEIDSDLIVGNKATSTVALWIGSAGTANNLNLAGGDLFVQDGLEVDGTIYGDRATSTSATTTNYLMVGSNFTLPASWNYNEDLAVSGDAVIANKATSTVALWVGSGGTANNLNLAGGDLYVQDDLEADGSIWFDSATTTDSLFVGGYASTTKGLFTQGNFYSGANATTTGHASFGTTNEYVRIDFQPYLVNQGAGNIPWLTGRAVNGIGIKAVAIDGALFVKETGDANYPEPIVLFLDSDEVEVSRIYANTPDDSIMFSNAAGGYRFDGMASTTGDLFVSGGTFDLTTSTGTTTPGIFSQSLVYSTSTISAGVITNGATKKSVGCLELAATSGAYYHCYIDTVASSLVCRLGRCN